MNNPNEKTTEASPPLFGRRRFLIALSAILGSVGAVLVAIPTVAFILGALYRKRDPVWRSVGSVDQFKTGHTVAVSFENSDPLPWDGKMARTAAWLRRQSEEEFIAFSVNCTHLGCPVRWKADADLFLCPCHGGVYYSDGSVAGGPPPRPLPRYKVRLRDGQVEIQTEPIPIV